ncbi:galactose ABC transporter substrate-binding protein [Clostridium sp.]|uniref:galactose ABC transporter substrate-binding protein n=1 Tax=Clostridium sp. TaxID=1506 RepID=UPI002844D1BD|nr:galactose ABC transporter substrate-binding protein [Clostridium sp.]MDR3595858.1 galactose ABC transporter substrate-binding protein [Clostridium sp.]
MNISKKILSIIIVSIILLHGIENNVYATPSSNTQNPVKVGVFLHNSNDLFLSNVEKNLEDIQKENENKVQFTFFDAKDNQLIQNESINQAINKKFDLLVINLVSRNKSQIEDVIEKVIQKNIPFIIYISSNPEITNFIKNYPRAVVIGVRNEEDGLLQGEILADTWNSNKEILDKNHDNIMQYVILQGPSDHPASIERSKYSILAINNSGIKTQELSSVVCNWDEECARAAMESIFLANGDKIEAIIANNDAMAIGAIKTLQKYGFNKGNNSKYIPVIGFDGLPEAKELIKQGIMTGTVVQDPSEHAKAIYAIGMNLVSGVPPLNDTNYKFDETGIQVGIPVYKYVK